MTREYLVRAFLEGTVLNLGWGSTRLRSLGLNLSEIRATGGGARSRSWLQISADILQTPVVRLTENEAAAFGAAIQSLWTYFNSTGQRVAIDDMTRDMVKAAGPSIDPDPETRLLYRELQDRFDSLRSTLTPEFEKQDERADGRKAG